MKLKEGPKMSVTEYHIIDEQSNLIAICHSAKNRDFIISRFKLYDKIKARWPGILNYFEQALKESENEN